MSHRDRAARRQLALTRAYALAKRELRSVGTWTLACGSLAYGLWSTWSASRGAPSGGVPPWEVLSTTSWIGVLVLLLTFLLPLWIIERMAEDQRSQWVEPLFVVGWRREAYVLSLFTVIIGVGGACLMATTLLAGAFALIHGGSLPGDAGPVLVAGIPTLLASGAGGLLLVTLFRDRATALSVAALAIAIPVVVSALYVFNVDRLPPEFLRDLLSIHLPPIRLDPSVPWVLYKLAYAAAAVWLSLVLAARRIGRRP
jgi:hypothetical protein